MHISGKGVFHDINGASQQRDCPGFTPDSLLIRIEEWLFGTDQGAKIIEFGMVVQRVCFKKQQLFIKERVYCWLVKEMQTNTSFVAGWADERCVCLHLKDNLFFIILPERRWFPHYRVHRRLHRCALWYVRQTPSSRWRCKIGRASCRERV